MIAWPFRVLATLNTPRSRCAVVDARTSRRRGSWTDDAQGEEITPVTASYEPHAVRQVIVTSTLDAKVKRSSCDECAARRLLAARGRNRRSIACRGERGQAQERSSICRRRCRHVAIHVALVLETDADYKQLQGDGAQRSLGDVSVSAKIPLVCRPVGNVAEEGSEGRAEGKGRGDGVLKTMASKSGRRSLHRQFNGRQCIRPSYYLSGR